MKAIVNTKLILENGIIFDGAIVFDGGVIVAADRADKVEIPKDCEIIDAKGKYTAPGFVDIHCHGSAEHYFYDEPIKCCEHFIKHGQTTVLPTFYMTMSMDEMLEGAARIKAASGEGVGKIMDGLYMEGPFMEHSGAMRYIVKWADEIPASDYEKLFGALCDYARVWAVDPNRPGVDKFMAYAHEKKKDVIFALGHSSATVPQCESVAKYGVKVQTHHSNSGRPKSLCQSQNGAGCDEYTLYNPDMFAELICDEVGIHVMTGRIRMVVRTKGVEKIILISDSMPSLGDYKNDEAAGIAYGPDLNYDEEGRLAGSHLTLDAACRNLMTHTGYGLCHAVRMASTNPAKLLGIDDKVGSIEVGKKANLIIIDDAVNVEKVFLEGELMVCNQ